MLGSNTLETAIGIFAFLLMSTIYTAIRRVIEARLNTRTAYLEQGIRQLLNDIVALLNTGPDEELLISKGGIA